MSLICSRISGRCLKLLSIEFSCWFSCAINTCIFWRLLKVFSIVVSVWQKLRAVCASMSWDRDPRCTCLVTDPTLFIFTCTRSASLLFESWKRFLALVLDAEAITKLEDSTSKKSINTKYSNAMATRSINQRQTDCFSSIGNHSITKNKAKNRINSIKEVLFCAFFCNKKNVIGKTEISCIHLWPNLDWLRFDSVVKVTLVSKQKEKKKKLPNRSKTKRSKCLQRQWVNACKN